MGDVGGPPSAEEVVRDFMAAFMAARPTGDAATLSRFFSEDAEYCNGQLEPVHGREAIVADLARMMSLGGEVDADHRRPLVQGEFLVVGSVTWRSSGRSHWHQGAPLRAEGPDDRGGGDVG